jgi:hypothetical protein
MRIRSRGRPKFTGKIYKDAIVAAISDLALIIFAAPDTSLALEGIKPQRTNAISRLSGFWRRTGIDWVGANVVAQ